MKRVCVLGAMLVCVIALVGIPTFGNAATSPAWQTLQGDARRSGAGPANGPSNLQFATTASLPPGISSSPAVDASGNAYIGDDNGQVYKLSPSTSVPQGSFDTGAAVKSSPTLSNDSSMLFVGSNNGKLYGITTADMKQAWATDLQGPIVASPLLSLDGNTIFVPINSGVIYSVKASDGSIQGKISGLGTAIPGSLALSIDGGTIYAALQNGTLLAFPVSGFSGTNATPFYLNYPPSSTPSVDQNGNIYVATGAGSVISFSPGNSAARWTYTVPTHQTVTTSAAFFQTEAIVGAADGHVYALSQQNGQQVWQYPQGPGVGAFQSSPVVTAGNGHIYIGSTDGTIYVLDSAGHLLKSRFVGTSIDASPAVAADGSVWMASEGGTVFRIQDIAAPPTVPPAPTITATPVATNTPVATATSVATNTPVATAMPTQPAQVPLTVTVKGNVKPGTHQTVQVTSSPSTIVKLRITYPNGDHQSHAVTTDASGHGSYDFVQGGSKTMHNKFSATVVAKAGSGTAQNTVTKTYTIGFGTIDVSAEPRSLAVGKTVDIFVHAAKGSKVVAVLSPPGRPSVTLKGTTGPKGFASMKYKIPSGFVNGKNQKVKVTAKFASGSPSATGSTTFTVS